MGLACPALCIFGVIVGTFVFLVFCTGTHYFGHRMPHFYHHCYCHHHRAVAVAVVTVAVAVAVAISRDLVVAVAVSSTVASSPHNLNEPSQIHFQATTACGNAWAARQFLILKEAPHGRR